MNPAAVVADAAAEVADDAALVADVDALDALDDADDADVDALEAELVAEVAEVAAADAWYLAEYSPPATVPEVLVAQSFASIALADASAATSVISTQSPVVVSDVVMLPISLTIPEPI
jgi:hypothetical protein